MYKINSFKVIELTNYLNGKKKVKKLYLPCH